MRMEFMNFLRISIVVMGSYIILLMTIVIGAYVRSLKTSDDRIRRVLTGHIVLIGLSYGIFVVSAIVEMMIRYDLPMTWRTPSCSVATLIGVVGLHLMIWRLMLMRSIHPK